LTSETNLDHQYLPNHGLPPLDLEEKPYSYFEFWPAWFFYTPVVIYWLFLSIKYRSIGLPMTVNPNIPLAGMVGESKTAILDMAGDHAKQYILPYLKFDFDGSFDAEHCIRQCEAKGLVLPLVAKPDLGCRGAGVRLIHTVADLDKYLREFPVGSAFLMQELAPYFAEAGVFYVRQPESDRGKIVSITLKYLPVVVGDGTSTLKALIENDARANKVKHLYFERENNQLDSIPARGEHVPLAFAGSHSRGSIFRNGDEFISPGLEDRLDQIMQDFPEFHYGRLDIKFADVESFVRGDNFVIIEVNGASSEATHIWDSRGSLRDVFRTLFWQYRTLFSMGQKMRDNGVAVPSVRELIKTWLRELRRGGEYPPNRIAV